jgi:pyruvate dehydrogenase E2 component (dihydrolipoamide acetyltransferase)
MMPNLRRAKLFFEHYNASIKTRQMAEVIRMPRMSDTMEEGNIIGWLKKEGDAVEAGETLAEVETDKATMELDAFRDGVLLHIAVKEGPVPIDGVIAVIGEKGEDWKKVLEEAEGGGNGKEQAAGSAEPAPAKAEAQPVITQEEPASAQAPADDKRLKASPLARNLAKDAGVDLATLEGSGDGGRIVKRDVESFIEKKKTEPAPAPEAKQPEKEPPAVPAFAFTGGEANFEEKLVSQMRKTIARRLSESKFSAPHFYLTLEIDMGKAIQLRQRINEVSPVKISFNDLVLKSAAAALRQHPAVNSSWLGDRIRTNKDIHIGVAVAVSEGLLVPVIRFADMKTLSQINTEVKALAERAKDRKLQPEEMQGNTFTISNLGMFGIEEFTAIINPPDACILAVGAIVEKPVVKNGEIAVGSMMKVTLSCDHRVVDGATGAQFLQTFKAILEDPIRIMI